MDATANNDKSEEFPKDQLNTLGSTITNVTFNVVPCSSRGEFAPNFENEATMLSDKLRAAYKKITLPQVSWMDNRSLLLDSQRVKLTLGVGKSSITLKRLFDGNEFPTRVLLEGPPGYGKTTLAHKIVNDWALNREYTQRFKLAFLVKLRDLDQSIEKELADIAESCGYENTRTVDKIICKFADTTLVVLDGLDELAEENRMDVLNVLFRSQFGNATVVTTCRTGVYKLTETERKLLFKGVAKSSDDYHDKRIRVKGVAYYDMKKLLEKLITGTDKRAIIKRIEQIIKPVKSLFKCPLYILLLVFVVKDNPGVEIETQTDLFKNLIDCIIRRSCTKLDRELPDNFTIFGLDESCREFRDVFFEFGRISAECLKKNSLEFECNNTTDKIYELGFLIRSEKKCKFKTRYHYAGFNLTILEFAAAYSMWVDFKINGRFFAQEEIIDMVKTYADGDASSLAIFFFGGLLGDEITTFCERYRLYSAIFSTARRSIFDVLADGSSKLKLSSAVVPFFPPDITCESILENTHVWQKLVCFTKVQFKNITFREFELLPQNTNMEHLVVMVDERKDKVYADISVMKDLKCNIFDLSIAYEFNAHSSKKIEQWLEIFKSVSAQTKKLYIHAQYNPILNGLIAKNVFNNMPIDTLSCTVLSKQPSKSAFITHIVDNNQLQQLNVNLFGGRASCVNILSAVSSSSYLETLELHGIPPAVLSSSYLETLELCGDRPAVLSFIDISVITNNGGKKWKRVKLTEMTVDCTTPLVNPKCITEFENGRCANSPQVFNRVIPEVLHCDYEYIIDAFHETLFAGGWHTLQELILNLSATREWDELVPCLSKLYSVNSLTIKLHVDLCDEYYNCEREIAKCLKSVTINTILFDFRVRRRDVKFSPWLDVIVKEKIKIQTLGLINSQESNELLPFIPALLGCLDDGNINVVVLSGCKKDLFGIVTHSSLDYLKYNIQHTSIMDFWSDFWGDLLCTFWGVSDCICIKLK